MNNDRFCSDVRIEFTVYQEAAAEIANYLQLPFKKQKKLAPRTIPHVATYLLLSNFGNSEVQQIENPDQQTTTYLIDAQNFPGDLRDLAFTIGMKTGEQGQQPYHSLSFHDMYNGTSLVGVKKGDEYDFGEFLYGLRLSELAEKKEPFYKKFVI
jgi:hypothetical protein